MSKYIKIASKIENISKIEGLIDELSNIHKIGNEIYGNILIAVVEAVTNCIIHGNKLDEKKSVYIKQKIEDGKIEFSIRDEGNGFDYRNVPDPTKPVNVEKPHGRGVFLMVHLSDELEFKNDGIEVIMRFKL